MEDDKAKRGDLGYLKPMQPRHRRSFPITNKHTTSYLLYLKCHLIVMHS